MARKRNGKVNACAIDEAVNAKDFSEEKSKKNRRGLTDKEIDERIKSLVDVILREYNYKKCLVIVGDPDDIPEETKELLEGKGIFGFNCKNLGDKYKKYQEGGYDTYKFMCIVEKLFDKLVEQFDNLENFIAKCIFETNKEDFEYERT